MASRKKKTTAKKKTAGRGRKRPTKSRKRRSGRGRWLGAAALALMLAGAAVAAYVATVSITVSREFEARRWDVPAQVYATPLELYAGRRLAPDALVAELRRLGYQESPAADRPGRYRQRGAILELTTRAYRYTDETQPAQSVAIEFANGRIAAIDGPRGAPLALLRLDPLRIGSIFPAHGEDRLIVAPEDLPPLLVETLKAVEDRRFDEHHGIDVIAVLRAALVNLRAGEIRQGASTLTQQLVRSYFLSNARTWERKLREAVMAIALELHYDKDELMQAYVNEVYLAQDGRRAIHGFGLGSQFYFGKPLPELELHELALLVAQVRGPTYYNPQRHPERALARRNLVLEQMRAQGLIDAAQQAAAAKRELDVVADAGRSSSYYAGYLDLVRRQLYAEYPRDELERRGLTVLTTLDPAVQSSAEAALIEELDALENGRAADSPALDGAVVVTSPHNAEVLALVGSRKTGYDGFNRALDARRQIGSLIKPAVYLAALESGRYSLASLIDDSPISIELDNGTLWSPRNFSGEAHGHVPLVRALAESFNMATVRLGMDVGVDAVAKLLVRLGLQHEPRHFPSLLLGAIELTPYEVAGIYNTLANGGFSIPLRAVRAVVDEKGELVQRYPLSIEEAADAESVYALNQALVQVMERGTGVTARRGAAARVTVAGKTGTSDDLRDSWFAGFTSDKLVVTWVGNDDNRATGLTGATGAARVWTRVIDALDVASYAPPPPADANLIPIDYGTGLETEASCPDAVLLPVPAEAEPPRARGCGSTKTRIGSGIRDWLRDRLN
ncbi:MAG: penicillin-binding protein 1B [Gammaproteobacteria bacterium]|nr:penicillin-binding protein 1B [Gammaproteobacteria bacterium]